MLLATACSRALALSDTAWQRDITALQTLGYLPLTPAGAHAVRFAFPVPAALQAAADQQRWNRYNPFIEGAVDQFSRVNGLQPARAFYEGQLTPVIRKRLLSAKARPDPYPWLWVLVTKARPETLRIWQAQAGWVYRARVNTGVADSTPTGTWAIYQRLPKTEMKGVFPTPISWTRYQVLLRTSASTTLVGLAHGQPVYWKPYDDKDIRWVNYFFEGRGIHYFPRLHYGYPQSAGCVETSLSRAEDIYALLHIGVPVTIASEQINNVPGLIEARATLLDRGTLPSLFGSNP